MSPGVTFNDPELRRAAEETAAGIEAHAMSLDQVSGDVKALEAYLIRQCVFVETSQQIPGGLTVGEAIAWRSVQSHWRLIYSAPSRLYHAPLIEMPAAVRIRAQPALPLLLRKIAEAVR